MKAARRAVDGVLLLDKPAGLSSGSAVGWSKRLFNAEKAGHTGTLDPFATGLLPICFGEAAKFSRFMLDAEKGYRATLRLGEKSSTGDTEGEIVERRPVAVDWQRVTAVLPGFLGEQSQVPPMYSALKQEGVPLYKLARQGRVVDRESRRIQVHALAAISLTGDQLVIDTVVSKGTYVRVLAEDIGEALGCGAHLVGLRRTATGGFSLDDALSFDALESMTMAERDATLLPADALPQALPAVHLTAAQAAALGNGQVTHMEEALADGQEYRVYHLGRFLGIARATGLPGSAKLTVVRLMSTGTISSETT